MSSEPASEREGRVSPREPDPGRARARSGELDTPERDAERGRVRTGIAPFDERIEGLRAGGTYLFAGPPGPAKLVAGLHFVRAGLVRATPTALLTNADAEGILGVAEAWGFDLRDHFRSGRLRIVGFRDDFELRAVRTTEPDGIFDELDGLVGDDVGRILVDPASTFLSLGVPSQLGRTFLAWAGRTSATVCGTLAVEGGERVPRNADWLLQASTGLVVVTSRQGGLFQLEVMHALPDPGEDARPVTVELVPGIGLRAPERPRSRREDDAGAEGRPVPDPGRLLLLSLGDAHPQDLEAWARGAWSTEVLTDAVTAITGLQGGASFGAVVVHAERRAVRSAMRACRALRPLTAGAIVFATDDSIRSNDRIKILDAGADDCLSGGLDFGELGARLRNAMRVGGKRAPVDGAEPETMSALEGGSVSRATLAAEASRRAARRETAAFVVLAFSGRAGAKGDLLDAIRNEIRSEEGDLVAGARAGPRPTSFSSACGAAGIPTRPPSTRSPRSGDIRRHERRSSASWPCRSRRPASGSEMRRRRAMARPESRARDRGRAERSGAPGRRRAPASLGPAGSPPTPAPRRRWCHGSGPPRPASGPPPRAGPSPASRRHAP